MPPVPPLPVNYSLGDVRFGRFFWVIAVLAFLSGARSRGSKCQAGMEREPGLRSDRIQGLLSRLVWESEYFRERGQRSDRDNFRAQ